MRVSADPSREPIGFLVKRFPKLSETFVLEEVLGLERLGASLRIYTLEPPSDAIVHPAVSRVRASVTRVPASVREDVTGCVGGHVRVLLGNPVAYVRTCLAALRRGRQGLRDFVRAGWLAGRMAADGVRHLHAHFISAPADVAELAARLGGHPFSISAHAKDIYLSDAADLRRKLTAAAFTVSCTEFNCRSLRAIAPAAKVVRMYHGIDGSLFHPSRRAAPEVPARILCVGRLREKKGIDTLIEACAVLRQRGLRFACDVVGYGEQFERLQAMIVARGLSDCVRLRGKLGREALIGYYARAAVFVQPSRVAADGDRDGIPNVLLEAMAIGVPVVATRVSGIPEVVRDGENGVLVAPDEPGELADAVAHLLCHPAEGAAFAATARQTVVSNFDNDRNLHVVLDLLGESHVHGKTCAPA